MCYHNIHKYGYKGFPLFKNERIINMNWTLVLTIIQLLTSLFLILVVLFQSGKRSGLSGSISGAADTFMTKQKATTLDGKLAKATKWVGLSFALLTLILNLMQ